MRTLCPNLDREDGLETVLEVPIPEETFSNSSNKKHRSWQQNMKSWVKNSTDRSPPSVFRGSRNAEIQLLLGVVGAPLIPLPISSAHPITRNIKDHAIESSMAKYIVQQYVAATGGEKALNSIDSMYAMGKVKMVASEFIAGDGLSLGCNGLGSNGKAMKMKSVRNSVGEVGGFVLWQKRPELWCLELVVSGCKISAGSDGKVAWRQTPWHSSHASRGPPRPLRRFLQGLDPRSTSNLFFNSICIGEKTVKDEDCFVLKLEAESSTLRARSSSNVEIMRHTVWGYFSQRTGLLIQLEDSHLLRIKAHGSDSVFWETTMESHIQDYRTIDGINIAHGGRTGVSLSRGESSESHSRTRMEELWAIEEVDFNIKGLSMDCFLPPRDLKKEEEGDCGVVTGDVHLPLKTRGGSSRPVAVSKVMAIDLDDSENIRDDEEW
ncbi:replication factor C subunit, putative [Actinidia rufa]|uniref:Replication factor C subunit, putative n=1 Tax=Actinidia rufa TaxID=165716 RepID=A0A7J0GWP7_9ERIC|nr:replication factor C subunit, putative [Actinidia rufa]